VPMTPGPESSKTAIADGREPPETNAPRTDAMTTSHAWAFRTTLRLRAFGWSGIAKAKVIDRLNAALAEIAAMAHTDSTPGGAPSNTCKAADSSLWSPEGHTRIPTHPRA